MEMNSKVKDFLQPGGRISNGYFFGIAKSRVHSRNDLLADLVKGRRCLHFGCADHIDLIHKKRAQGSYLHDILTASASTVLGVDINEAAINHMREHGIENVCTVNELSNDMQFDIVCIPDVIEHLANVGEFLQGIREVDADEYVITTPNAMRLSNRILFRGELVNTDHRYWFSPYTLAKTLVEAGYTINRMWYTDFLPKRTPIRNLLKMAYPVCRDGIAVSASLVES